MSLIPDVTEIHRLLRMGTAKDDHRVTLTDITFFKTTDNNNHIFKAKAYGQDDGQDDGQDVIVKFTYEDPDIDEDSIRRLKNESQIYVDYLKPLWGTYVPTFYGFYLYNSSDPDETTCACIVLEYCGEPAVSDLSQLNEYRCHEYGIKQFRNDAIDLVLFLHSPKIGISHNALRAKHILDFKGKPLLIDFALSEPDECPAWKKCERLTREVLRVKEDELQQHFYFSVGCFELWLFLKAIEYSVPCRVKFAGRTYNCLNVTSAGDFYEQTLFKWPRYMSDQELWDESVKQWKRIRSNWKIYHPDTAEPPLGIIDLEEYQKANPNRSYWYS